MVQTRVTPAAGRGRGRPPLGRGRGRFPVVDPPAVEEVHADVAESVAPETGNRIVGRQGPQRVQSDDSDRVSMEGPAFHDYIR